ncbi:DUF3375 domain-containing protein [Lacipirellula parvula]|uniref:DUF3375 domain-containing protein n=1 Tax=Lacipirellula parvula TaxID=2650471 RepID=A0A5K7X5H5_9BACT|nr:DUF3375 domain-containing protein [Lacipirellula parvula]BBO31067.1 hypothetical protein PLANPX_0679 [Lacipirellula parvula]
MRLGRLLTYFSTSPAIRLLHATNAPFIITFFEQVFKQASRITLPHSELFTALVAYQEELSETHPGVLSSRADSYLNDWCSAESRWLQRLLESGRDEPLYQLTPHSEDVLVFLDRALDKDLGFVGTESRLKLVIDTLSDLVIGSSDDPEVRLQHLRAEYARIASEIEQIEATGQVAKYQPGQIRERFATAVTLLRQLQGDFRAVEESFRRITVEVQQRQIAGSGSRGGILEFALDSEDFLKREDQGVSFYAFVSLILSPQQTAKLETVIRGVRQITELTQQHEGLETIRSMVTLLQREAEKVMRTNHRLSATLRRLLDDRTHADRQRIAHLLREIQGQAISLAGSPASTSVGLTLDLELTLESPLRRAFWTEPPKFEAVDLTSYQPDADARQHAFEQLAALHHINWRELRVRIRQALALEHAPTLHDLLAIHPLNGGVVEVIAYLQIAMDDGHQIDRRASETLILRPKTPHGRSLLITVPRITFLSTQRNGHAR